MKEEKTIGEDNICPVTNTNCYNEACTPETKCTITPYSDILIEFDNMKENTTIQSISKSESSKFGYVDDLFNAHPFLFELGMCWGEKIWNELLSKYSFDWLEPGFMSPEEIAERKRLYDIYRAETDKDISNKLWKDYVLYGKELMKKYYPAKHQFEIRAKDDLFDREKLIVIMHAIESFLRNTDSSCYEMDSIDFIEKTYFNKRRKTRTKPSYTLQFNFKLD